MVAAISDISAYHIQINYNPRGKYPGVCAVMTGIFNKGSPKPRFAFVWHIKKELNYLNGLPDNLRLPVNLLSQKLASLLALKVASRISEICYLNIEYMVKVDDKYIFTFDKLTKS